MTSTPSTALCNTWHPISHLHTTTLVGAVCHLGDHRCSWASQRNISDGIEDETKMKDSSLLPSTFCSELPSSKEFQEMETWNSLEGFFELICLSKQNDEIIYFQKKTFVSLDQLNKRHKGPPADWASYLTPGTVETGDKWMRTKDNLIQGRQGEQQGDQPPGNYHRHHQNHRRPSIIHHQSSTTNHNKHKTQTSSRNGANHPISRLLHVLLWNL